ncbi:winged helix-turn-helix transcriptional regulator [Candidatus Dojkabacteria bacterium]|nr:winged helix-turn-helix transcriptional regulator [Candidatus Dojkabacteria bacterium]
MTALLEKKIEQLRKLLVINRIRILELLYQGDTCVCKMVDRLKLKHSLISHHLKILARMGHIKSSKNGQHRIYNLANSKRKLTAGLLEFIKK